MTMFEQLGRRLAGTTTREITEKLLKLSDHNPDTKESRMKDLAARMLMPVSTHVKDCEGFTPASVSVDWESDTTTLTVEQFNQVNEYEWSTTEIYGRMDKIAEH